MKRIEVVLNLDQNEVLMLINVIHNMKQFQILNEEGCPELDFNFKNKGILHVTNSQKRTWREFFKAFDKCQSQFSIQHSFLISELRDEVMQLNK